MMPAKSSSFASSSKQPRRRSRSASAAAQRDNGASSSRGGNRKAASQGAAGSSRNAKSRQEAIQVDSDDSDDDDDEEGADAGEYVIEAIVDHGCDPDRGDLVQVRWEGYGSDEDTWEPETKIRESANDIVNTYFANLPNARQKEKKEAEKRKQLYEKMERDRAKRERDKARASSNDRSVKQAGKQQGSQKRRQGKLDGYVKSAGASVTGGGSSSRTSKRKKAIESEEEKEEVDELEEEELAHPDEPIIVDGGGGGRAPMTKKEERLRERLDDLDTWAEEELKVFTIVPLTEVPNFHILFPDSRETQAAAWLHFTGHSKAILYPVEELRRKAPQELIDFLLAHMNFGKRQR